MSKSSRKKAAAATQTPVPAPAPITVAAAMPEGAKAQRLTRWALLALACTVLAALAGFWFFQFKSLGQESRGSTSTVMHASLVDETQCASCHTPQSAAWKGSHHAKAMAVAGPDTVLGNFNDARFSYAGTESRFYRKGAEFWVDTDGPDGKLASYKVVHTFGVEPLQQYLLELPGGRMQALGIAWDTGKKAWFHLYPKEKLTAKDELHWTKSTQNWNFMCAECHTTGLKRNFTPVDASYKTTWQALGVGCQACHGPASKHVEWAAAKGDKPLLPAHGFEVDLKNKAQPLLETCARCHSRRAPLDDGYANKNRLADDYELSLLSADLYHVDGQIKEEVFESGSFAQSKMFMKGVTCVDCHNPHSGETRAKGNALCLTCHNAVKPVERAGLDTSTLQRKDYDNPAHTHHPKGSAGATCVACHMPGKFYMGNDFRHDHALIVPRPDLSRSLGTPNACNTCHKDQTPEWAARKVEEWFGKRDRPASFGELMHSLRTGGIGAADALGALVLDPTVPPIRRATALAEAARYPSEATVRIVTGALKDADPVVRNAAVDATGMLPPEARTPLLTPLLADPVRAVRIAAARLLVDVRDQLGGSSAQWQKAIAEYKQVQTALAERPESHLNLAGLYRDMAQHDDARRELQQALTLSPGFLPAITMQSEYLGAAGRQAEALALLQDALVKQPDSGLLHYALGMAQIRAGDRTAALQSLKTAALKSPQDALYGYVYAVALHDTGNAKAAIAQLDKVIKAHPEHRDSAMTAVRYRAEIGDSAGAQALASQWLKINPGEPSLARTGTGAQSGNTSRQQ